MEEDIKILQELIAFLNTNGNYIADENFKEEKLAIENLIKGYRELEEREIWSTATIEGLKKDFIPKSKIKEKIEPVIDSLEKNGFVGYADELRDIMSEIIEDKNEFRDVFKNAERLEPIPDVRLEDK